jgi:hypothetical protein
MAEIIDLDVFAPQQREIRFKGSTYHAHDPLDIPNQEWLELVQCEKSILDAKNDADAVSILRRQVRLLTDIPDDVIAKLSIRAISKLIAEVRIATAPQNSGGAVPLPQATTATAT